LAFAVIDRTQSRTQNQQPKTEDQKPKTLLLKMQRAISHFCQNCRAANALGQEFCERCGTRLMLVVRPPSMRLECQDTTPNEEHLLERLTILENTLARLAERLEQGLDRKSTRLNSSH